MFKRGIRMDIKLRHLAGTSFIIVIVIMIIFVISQSSEGFANRCGVGMPSCSGLRCINGHCKSDNPPKLPNTNLSIIQ